MPAMRVVVTGSDGFVGRALLARLRAQGHEIVVADRARCGDLTGFRGWGELLDGAAALVHLAALAHGRGRSEAEIERVNVGVTLAAAQAAAASGARFVFLSSVKVHGEETYAGPFRESSPLRPADAYARSKARAEEALAGLPGLRGTVLRPPLVHGPGVRANFLALMRAIAAGWPLPLASVRNARSLIAVDHLAAAVAAVLDSPGRALEGAWLVSGEAVSTPRLCRALGEALGRPARLVRCPVSLLELIPGMTRLTRSLVIDDTAFRAASGWQPAEPFEASIARTAAWFCEQAGMHRRSS
jgi:UDP-glucose 4-epimerase